MNAITAQVSGQDFNMRNDAIKRRNAEAAYNLHEKYNGDNQKTLESLENLLKGKAAEVPQQEFTKLDAGQMKQVALPIGKTLEETIDLWRNVRVEAISGPQPTTADYQLAATASSKIRQVEAQIGLHQQAKSEIEITAINEEVGMSEVASMELPTAIDREVLVMQKRYEQAISSYSFHVQMQKNGFESDMPSFYKIA